MAIRTIHPIVVGSKVFDKGMMTYQHGYGTPYTIPIYAWLLLGGPEPILVDTGEMRPIVSEEREKSLGGRILTIEEGLARFGLTPADVEVVLHTHLHNDHCENDYKFTRARFYVHEKELAAIHDPHPLDFRYLEDYILDVEENGQVEALRGDFEVAPGVRMLHTPAHTEGGMSVAVDTAKGTAVISGFCVIGENFNPPREVTAREMEVIPPGTCVDPRTAYDTVLRIKNMADILVPLHEPSFADGAAIG